MHISGGIFLCPRCKPGESSWFCGHLDETSWLLESLESEFCASTYTSMVSLSANHGIRYAWDLVSRAFDRVTLQSPPNACFTKYRSAVIVTESGGLLLWSFGHGLANIDLAMPKDEAKYRGPAKPKQIPRTPLSYYERRFAKVIFHPRDEDVFFVATIDDRIFEPDVYVLLWVYEFSNKRCCRIFTYEVPPERRHWNDFGVQEVDAHGTYQLLEQDNPTDDFYHMSCVTFNTISKSFGALRFQTPVKARREVSLVWNGHLVLGGASPEKSTVRPRPLVALGQPPNPHRLQTGSDIVFMSETPDSAMENGMTSVAYQGSSVIDVPRAAIEASEQGTPKYDVIRAPDVSPSTSCIGAGIGLRYMLSFFGGQCNWEGFHARDCSSSSGLQPSDGPLYPLNYFGQGEFSYSWGGGASAIFGDDDFLLVVNSKNYYTVFAVDEDGKIAGTMRDGTSDNAEGISREEPQIQAS